mgnify:CR=1 FL=1
MRPLVASVGGSVLLMALLVSCGTSDMKLRVVGDDSAKGAAVFLDNAPVARLEAAPTRDSALLRTSRPARGLRRCYEPGDTIVATGHHFEDAFFTVVRGEHDLWVVSEGGDTLKARISCTDNPRVEVSFKCRLIEQVER